MEGVLQPQPPRALVLSNDDRKEVIKRLAKGVLRFADLFEGSSAGLLCQVWLPEVTGEHEVVLKTKGMPFCVAGVGDLLALFRCISCRFAFGTDVKKVSQLGAPGRVFTSSEPELTCNVQKYSKTAYLRKAEAEQCQVQSTLLLPVFLTAARHGCVGVLEVVQTSEDMHFREVADLISSVLEKCQLFTCTRASIERQLPRATTTATLLLPPSVDILRQGPRASTSEDSGERANSTDGVPMADEGVLEQAARAGSAGGGSAGGGGGSGGEGGGGGGARSVAARRGVERIEEGDDEGEEPGDGVEDDDDDLGAGAESGDEGAGDAPAASRPGGARSGGPARRRGKGSGNPGKPGVRLSLEELQSQFGVGLKEAAARLGICPTTLKRACRRHGIQRWPRRQLMKVNQALDHMEATQGPLSMLSIQQAQQQQRGPGVAAALQQQQQQQDPLAGLPMPDTRWITLSQFIPAFQQALDYNDNNLAGFGQPPLGMGQLPQGGNPLSLGSSWGANGLLGPPPGGPLALDSAGRRLGAGQAPPAGAGAGRPPSAFSQLLLQFPALKSDSQLPRGGFAPLGAAPAGSMSGTGRAGAGAAGGPPAAGPHQPTSSGLPPGVVQVPPAGAGFGAAFPAASGDGGQALSGISSFGQPPPPADVVAAQQRLAPFRHGQPRDASTLAALQGLVAAGAANNQGGLGCLPAGAGLSAMLAKSWQLPSLPSTMLGTSLDFDLAKAGVLAEDQMRDDDVGFLDPTVLEMLLQEDAGRAAAAAAAPAGNSEEASRGIAISQGFSSLKFR